MSGNITKLLGGSFDVNSIDDTEFKVIDAGDYIAQIDSADMEVTKNGGNAIVVTFSIITGPNEGFTMKEWLNVINDNPKAVEVAYKKLAKIGKAIGIETLDDTNQLIGKRLKLTISVEEQTGTYVGSDGVERKKSKKNKIDSFSSVNQVATPVTKEEKQPTQAKKMPWDK